LADEIQRAIEFKGFSILDIWGVCPGRYTKKNRLTPKAIEATLAGLPPMQGVVAENKRQEYGAHYREAAARQRRVGDPLKIEARFAPPRPGRQEVVLLGSAGQRIITAGEILCIAGLTAGLQTTQKNEYNITVLRGPSISEVILSPEEIDYTGIERPGAIVVLDQEGANRRRAMFDHLEEDTLVVKIEGVAIPACKAQIHAVDLKALGIKKPDWALASLAILATQGQIISLEMLTAALKIRFKGKILESSLDLIQKASSP
jgi:Pyruvate/2-oxoacid:ferredoxin oxidoreductase gamma subunit